MFWCGAIEAMAIRSRAYSPQTWGLTNRESMLREFCSFLSMLLELKAKLGFMEGQ